MAAIKINFLRNPYRGIIKEIAIEKGVTVSAISRALKRNKPDIVKIVNQKVSERREIAESNPRHEVDEWETGDE